MNFCNFAKYFCGLGSRQIVDDVIITYNPKHSKPKRICRTCKCIIDDESSLEPVFWCQECFDQQSNGSECSIGVFKYHDAYSHNDAYSQNDGDLQKDANSENNSEDNSTDSMIVVNLY